MPANQSRSCRPSAELSRAPLPARFCSVAAVCFLQVVMAWSETAREEAEQHLLWHMQHVPAADAHRQWWLLKHGLRLWGSAHQACLEEQTMQIKRQQAWQQVSGWLGELQQSSSGPHEHQQAVPAESIPDQWLEQALMNPPRQQDTDVLKSRADDAWLEDDKADDCLKDQQLRGSATCCIAEDSLASSEPHLLAAKDCMILESRLTQPKAWTQQSAVVVPAAKHSSENGDDWLADLLASSN